VSGAGDAHRSSLRGLYVVVIGGVLLKYEAPERL
jgi:hypothetical protein